MIQGATLIINKPHCRKTNKHCDICAKRKHRPAWEPTQFNQSLLSTLRRHGSDCADAKDGLCLFHCVLFFTVWRKSNVMWVHHSNHIIKTRGNGLLNSLLKQQSVKLLIVSVLLKLHRWRLLSKHRFIIAWINNIITVNNYLEQNEVFVLY